MYKIFVSTLHCTLENGADLYVNECQKIRHYRLGLLKKEQERRKIRRMPNHDFFYFARCVRKLRYYSDIIQSFDWKSAIEHDGGV